mgnify:CR=1 FL=1
MHTLRRSKLRHLLDVDFNGNRGAFLKKTGLSKGRLSQLLDPDQPFGDVAAKNLCDRLDLPADYFDSMGAQTVHWAVAFDALPQHVKDKWADLVKMIGGAPPPE